MSIEDTPGPLLDAARNTPTALWNDSSDPSELAQSISFGGVGATCNPTIAYTCINQRRETEGMVSPRWARSSPAWSTASTTEPRRSPSVIACSSIRVTSSGAASPPPSGPTSPTA